MSHRGPLLAGIAALAAVKAARPRLVTTARDATPGADGCGALSGRTSSGQPGSRKSGPGSSSLSSAATPAGAPSRSP